jgi:hypothetical protein
MHSPPEPQVDAPATESSAARGALRLDLEKYWPALDEMDLSDAQKAEVLEILWAMMSAFVDLGFGVNSVAYALPQRPTEIPRESRVAAEKSNPAQ